MKRIHIIAGALFGVLLFIWALALAQPAPGDTTGIVAGTPTQIGNVLVMIVQLLTAAIGTFLMTKVATKLTWIKGWVTVASGTTIGGLLIFVLNYLAAKVGLVTGLTVIPGALSSYVLASIIYEYRTHKTTV